MTEGAYAELHCHSNYSFQEGASFTFELVQQARKLGLAALALTDHDNLCGAMEFAKTAKALDLQGIIGAEVTLAGNHHFTLLAANVHGYNNLCRLLSHAHIQSPRRSPALDPNLLAEFSEGLIALSGCRQGEVPSLVAAGRVAEAERAAERYRDWFGPDNFFLELQRNLVYGDDERIAGLVRLGERLGLGVVATNNVHYHVRSRHRLQDALVTVRARTSLEESQRERRPNSEFFLKSPRQMAKLFREYPSALRTTLLIAERCSFDLTRDLNYRFPNYPVPPGFTPDTYLEKLCYETARRRYPLFPEKVRLRLEHELRLIRKHGLAGFLLIYHEIILMAQQVMVDLGLCEPGTPVEECLPGRGRGSSVAMLVGYLIGLSHIDPLQYNLSLERFLPEDAMATVPDIDLDFPRNIREVLIKRVHAKWGWDHAALTGMIATYDTKGAIRDLGKALGLPPEDIDKLAKRVEHTAIKDLKREMQDLPDFQDKVEAPGWRDLLSLATELDGFPKYLAQHPGGMVISSTPLMDLVPVQPGAIDGRFIIQWDKDAIDDAGFVKIDFLALGALSQMQEALALIERRHGKGIDLSRIDFEDQAVYGMIHRADTIGIFQIESAAQMQTVVRLRPRNLMDMAHEVGAVRPGVGVNDGVALYLARRLGEAPVLFDHPLERRALERTFGVILFQDQVNQLAIDVAGFSPSEADQFRRAFGRKHNRELLETWWQKFRAGAAAKGVNDRTALKIFKKFNGFYMFPEAHAVAFGITAYQAAWLKLYYPLESLPVIYSMIMPRRASRMRFVKEEGMSDVDNSNGAPRFWAERFLTDLAVVRSANTVRAYRQDLTRWLAFCSTHGVEPLQAQPRTVIDFIRTERERPTRGGTTVSARTVVRRLAAIRQWYAFLSLEPELTGIRRNPVPGGTSLRTASGVVSGQPALLRYDRTHPETLTAGEVTSFAAHLTTTRYRDKAIVGLLKDGDLRIHEALSLRLQDIHWAGRRVTVQATKSRMTRVVPLTADALALLSAYLRSERPKEVTHDYVFVCLGRRNFGQPFRYRAWVYICEQARQKAATPQVHAHAFRHTAATNLAESGMPLDSLRQLLGHRRLDTTLIYSEVRNGRLQREYDAAMTTLPPGPPPGSEAEAPALPGEEEL
ncbi:MAG: DNA polymerase III subunit alpha [Chloroflexi bacterium]|nr:DNA polymerase III subunit alpha [Chloroflexota bacterium]